MRDLEKMDFILVVGADPVHEAPMLALALRQAWRRGATVAVIDPRPVSLPFEFEHLPVPPDGIDLCLNLLARAALTQDAAEGRLSGGAVQFYEGLTSEYPADPALQDRLMSLGMKLRESQNPAVVCNTAVVRETTPGLAAGHARLLKEAKGQGGLFYLLPGPNAWGAALLAESTEDDPLAALEIGTVKALLVVENDPLWSYPEQERLLAALDKLELLVVLDYLPSATVARAQVFLPTVTVFEAAASHFVNQEGRLQQAQPLYQGGAPIRQVAGGNHPPRTFLDHVPDGEPRPGAEILEELLRQLRPGAEEGRAAGRDFWEWLSYEHEVFARLASLSDSERAAGVRILSGEAPAGSLATEPALKPAEPRTGQVELLLVDQTFGTEELAGYSPHIHKVEEEPSLLLHKDVAANLGLAAGDRVTLKLPGGEVQVRLSTSSHMAREVAVLPRHRELKWQKLKGWQTWLALEGIKKVQAHA